MGTRILAATAEYEFGIRKQFAPVNCRSSSVTGRSEVQFLVRLAAIRVRFSSLAQDADRAWTWLRLRCVDKKSQRYLFEESHNARRADRFAADRLGRPELPLARPALRPNGWGRYPVQS